MLANYIRVSICLSLVTHVNIVSTINVFKTIITCQIQTKLGYVWWQIVNCWTDSQDTSHGIHENSWHDDVLKDEQNMRSIPLSMTLISVTIRWTNPSQNHHRWKLRQFCSSCSIFLCYWSCAPQSSVSVNECITQSTSELLSDLLMTNLFLA